MPFEDERYEDDIIILNSEDRAKIKSLLVKYWNATSNLMETACIHELTKLILTEDEIRDLQYEIGNLSTEAEKPL